MASQVATAGVFATDCSHQDSSRKTVGVTAHGTAYLRFLESKKGDSALFNDPFAEVLAGEVGKTWMESFGVSVEQYSTLPSMVDRFAVRTKLFDDFIKESVLKHGLMQVCVIGAGLDTRPWRLFKTEEMESFADLNYFEVDFPESFAYKLPTLKDAGAVSHCGEYHSVQADLSLPTWMEKLINEGFQVDKKTVWILEGLTGYLNEAELSTLISYITDKLSANGSKLMASFVGVINNVISLHRFRTDAPLDFMQQRGSWKGTQEDLMDFMLRYGKLEELEESAGVTGKMNITRGGLFIVDLTLEKSVV